MISNMFPLIFIIASINSIVLSAETRFYPNSNLTIANNRRDLTQNISGDEARFFMIADWGGLGFYPYKTFVQKQVADYMEELNRREPVHATLALGDNFYFYGVSNVNDQRFQSTFENVYDSKSLNMPWFIQLGNHDYLGNASAQIAYTNKSNRWIMPDYFYTVDLNVQDGSKNLVHVIMIDTILLCGLSENSSNFDLTLSEEDRAKASIHFNYIETKLQKASANKVPYVIIAGHYPVWSTGDHGPTYCLTQRLRPLLFKYNVTAYLSGHDHILEHLEEVENRVRVHYVINGATAFVKPDDTHKRDVPAGSVKYEWASWWQIRGAVCLIKANSVQMNIYLRKSNGDLLHQITVPNKYL